MAVVDLTDWLDDFGRPGVVWFVKRLSGNDTLANGSHQAGPYVPKQFLFAMFPSMNRPEDKDPEVRFDLFIDSHADHRVVRAVWYNGRVRGAGTRNEARVTNLGGKSSALLDPESTGALTVFAFVREFGGDARACHAWVCRTRIEEDILEERIGAVEPGRHVVWPPETAPTLDLFAPAPARVRTSCRLSREEIPASWLEGFPSGADIIRKAVELRGGGALDPDERLLRRRECEYEIFLSVEEALELPVIRAGFDDIGAFISKAQTILQRRKARSGRSLELHAREIFVEEGLVQGLTFDHSPQSENGKEPDFLFPSQHAYEDPAFPTNRLRMLAVKTTIRDRWRQVLEEADRIHEKHLLTLQEGVSVSQFRQIREARVRLVVPSGLHSSYPPEVRPELVTLESFIADIRLLQQG